MNENIIQLEYLPNEILIEIFQYLDARDLFHAFYNLNLRLNELLQSPNNPCFTCVTSNSHDNELYAQYIHTLILDCRVNVNLNNFVNIHHLKIVIPTYEQLKQLKLGEFINLTHLSIGYQNNHFSLHMPNLFEKIFSNGFQKLKSCDLFEPRIIPEIKSTHGSSPSSLSLSILKVEAIRLSTYQVILSTCPNLYFLQLTVLDSNEKKSHITSHENLKQMVIKYTDFIDILNDGDIEHYLSYVPNLESLTFHRSNADAHIHKYLKYKWLVEIINRYLLNLQRFKCHFHVFQAKQLIIDDKKNIIYRLKENFERIHNQRYQSRFIFHSSPLPFWRT